MRTPRKDGDDDESEDDECIALSSLAATRRLARQHLSAAGVGPHEMHGVDSFFASQGTLRLPSINLAHNPLAARINGVQNPLAAPEQQGSAAGAA